MSGDSTWRGCGASFKAMVTLSINGKSHQVDVPPDMPALSDLYDRLGFGPFLRRQGERLAQLPAG